MISLYRILKETALVYYTLSMKGIDHIGLTIRKTGTRLHKTAVEIDSRENQMYFGL